MKIKGVLTNESIDRSIESVLSDLEKLGVLSDDMIRFQLTIEDILLDYHYKLGEDVPFCVVVKKKRTGVTVELRVKGESYDAIGLTDSLILLKSVHGWTSTPSWHYDKGKNVIRYDFHLRNSLKDNLGFTWKYAGPHKKYLFLALFLQLTGVGLMILAPILGAKIIVNLTSEALDQLLLTALMLFVVNIVSTSVLLATNWAHNVLYNKTLNALEIDISDKVLKIKNSAIDEHGTGLFIQRLTVDTNNLATAFSTFADNLSNTVQYLGILIAMLVINPVVFLVTVILLGIQIWLEIRREKTNEKNGRLYRNANERYTGLVGEIVRGSKDIKLIHAEKELKSELNQRIIKANSSRMYLDAINRIFRLVGGGLRELAALLFIILLMCLLKNHSIEVATALILYNYYTNLGTPAITLLGVIMDFFADFNLSCERLHALTDDHLFPKESFGELSKKDIKGKVSLEKVCFSYNVSKLNSSTRWVLYDTNLTINAGETVALVGRSGSGKTTIFNLLSKLYQPFSGKVMLDDIDIRELDSDSLRGSMSVVTQSPYIFHMSIRDNLKLAKPDMTDEEMKTAAKQACIDEDIEAMPEGYDTIVGEGGVNLSGGQRQRLAIARGLLHDSKILLLDEATSALDNITQAKIRETLQRIHGKCTVIMIAHRLSTVIGADRILYIKDGKIIADGRHHALIESCPEYRELYETEVSI